MEIDLTTPALLFSAISLIMLAYTNRFLSYAQLVRTLKEQYMENPSSVKAAQIANLRKRLYLTRAMQVAGIGSLLLDGIGDTLRVSLTDDPVEEVYAAKRILRACGLRRSGVNLISCPTCGRTAYDMIPLAEELERRLAGFPVEAVIKVASY